MPSIATQDPVNPNRAVVIDGKKFLWDGRPFHQQSEAASAADAYKNDNFEVQMVEVNGTYLIYTRRAVKEVLVTAP
jgi:hypothetical protein